MKTKVIARGYWCPSSKYTYKVPCPAELVERCHTHKKSCNKPVLVIEDTKKRGKV